MNPILKLFLGCAAFSVLAVPTEAQITIDRQVTIQPIQISNGSLVGNTNLILFEAETDKIWSQAGIDIKFLPVVTFSSATFINISSSAGSANSLAALATKSGAGQNSDARVLNLWFVNRIDNNASALGFTLQSQPLEGFPFTVVQNGISVANPTFTLNGGRGASVTIAHEIGHSLGLNHSTLGASGQSNLMSSTTIPVNGLSDIHPNGANLGQLNAAQIAQVRSVSQFVLPITPFIYTPPGNNPAAPRLEIIKTPAGVRLMIHGTVGSSYTLEDAGSLPVASWLHPTIVMLDSDPHSIDLPLPPGPTFWRMRFP